MILVTHLFVLRLFMNDADDVIFCQTMFPPDSNQIESIPSEFGAMAMLQELKLCKCIFNDTDDALGTLIGIGFALFLQA
jgi:hypothetical protein